MRKKVGIIVCLLILVLDVVAGILGLEGEMAQNKVRSLRLLIFECREPSHQAFVLGTRAALLLGLTHVVTNLMGLYNCIRKFLFFRLFLLACFILTWIVWGIGIFLLLTVSKSNNRSNGSCAFSKNRLLFIGGICCFLHGPFCIVYYLLSATGSSKIYT
ncbi:uncharacterized protein LOC113859710 [Abrus precatorius]|uniref:Uncharacterized protein LOC113859710 n=1 Tax=Abrus precatorius TaxID=3816 RepID=A0A8B8KWD7_ABRPR|nr:uncharacterized protein LOC113859710 [Abrus precatorius]